uniref:PAS domain-containing protein n=1 Tax=Emiliania huxleyi TaxID=2903 RepID=A0A7S3WCH3_EMIHU
MLDARFGLDLGAVRLIEATGCTVLLVGLDFTVEAALTAAPFGYSRQQLVGGSLLRILHPDEQVAFVQTVQALVAAAAGLEDVSQSTLRATHRILLPAPAGVGGGVGGGGGGVAMRASAVDTAISMVQCPGQPPRLLFSSRYLLPDGSAAAAGAFRVYPARQAAVFM